MDSRSSASTRIFLLSPAHTGGRRAQMLLRVASTLPISQHLRDGTLTIGNAFAFLSGLYFRGKLAYARMFGRHPDETQATAFVITATRGLMPADAIVSADMLREFALVDIAHAGPRYLEPLERDLTALAAHLSADDVVVLLGSVSTGKYVDVLARFLEGRLRFPVAFIGRGDMSRGGLLLRSAAAGQELEYGTLQPGVRPRGPRPPKLDPIS